MTTFSLNPSNSMPANVLHYTGLFISALILFRGLEYVLNGDLLISGFLSVVAVVVLAALTRKLIALKALDTPYRSMTPEYTWGGVYLIIFLILFPFSYHALTIELIRKSEIKTACLERLKYLDNLKAKYEKDLVDEQDLLDARANRLFNDYRDYHNTSALYKLDSLLHCKPGSEPFDRKTGTGLDDAIKEAKNDVKQRYELVDANKELTSFMASAKATFSNWDIQNVDHYYRSIDTQFAKYKASAQQKMKGFDPEITLDSPQNLRDPLLMLRSSTLISLLLSFVGLLLIHSFVLAPYFLTQRPGGWMNQSTFSGPRDGTPIYGD